MNCQQIDDAISELKPDKNKRLRNKNRVIDHIHSMHLQEMHDEVQKHKNKWSVSLCYMDDTNSYLRAKIVTANNSNEALGIVMVEFLKEFKDKGMHITMHVIIAI